MMQKFRVWHKELERLMSVQIMWLDEGEISELELNDSLMNESIPVYRDDVILMQSTGLFDVNGKEIFEGDVVRMHSGELLPVKLHHGMFEPVCYYISNVYEGVGNVFENPELLEHPDFREG
ncbi:TPA: hypothetical protein U0583_000673 [Streptococcus suis]|nr:hypothetical protein [Streptococcus suis]